MAMGTHNVFQMETLFLNFFEDQFLIAAGIDDESLLSPGAPHQISENVHVAYFYLFNFHDVTSIYFGGQNLLPASIKQNRWHVFMRDGYKGGSLLKSWFISCRSFSDTEEN